MQVTMMLADAAQEVGGKLYILGGGWSMTGPAPAPHAVVVKLDVPWTAANEKHRLRLSLIDADGTPVMVVTEQGEQPLRIEGEFEAGRPPGLPAGSDLDFAFVANVPPIPLTPGQRYEWRLWIDEESEDGWSRTFLTRLPT
jgi:hypothetical protein